MFVKWDCGCIGIRTVCEGRPLSIVLKECDRDRDDSFYCCYAREDLLTKSYRHLVRDELSLLLADLHKYLMDGDSLRAIKNHLGVKS